MKICVVLAIFLSTQGFAFAGGKATPFSDPSHPDHGKWRAEEDAKIAEAARNLGLRDVVAISKSNTSSNTTEVHVLSAESCYQNFVQQTRTGLHVTGNSWVFLLAPNRDLFAINKRNTSSNTTEVHVLSAASGYQSFVQQTKTGLGVTGSTWVFLL